jgi:hypothetical protein
VAYLEKSRNPNRTIVWGKRIPPAQLLLDAGFDASLSNLWRLLR